MTKVMKLKLMEAEDKKRYLGLLGAALTPSLRRLHVSLPIYASGHSCVMSATSF